MTTPYASAAVLTKDASPQPIDAGRVASAVRDGGIVVLPGALHRLGIYDDVIRLSLAAIGDACGPAAAAEIARRGFERLHEVLDGEQTEAAVHAVHARLTPRYGSFLKSIVHEGLGRRRRFYIHRSLMVRFFVPFEVEVRNAARFTQRANLGRLSGHPPHQDYWFSTPLNAFNVWMAISAVHAENGMSIFTDAWGAALPPDGGRAHPAQYLGVPLRIACEPGDLILFHSRHVHASALNLTAATRFVVTGRFCLEQPVAMHVGDLGRTCLYSPLVGTRFERYAAAATRVSPEYAVERLKQQLVAIGDAVERRLPVAPARWAARAARRLFRYRRGDVRPYVPAAIRRAIAPPASLDDVQEGQIAPLDADTCVARVGGRLHAFERRCPHEGADLALGYVSGGRVYCPWHSYWFDPATGRGPCSAIRAVHTFVPERTGGALG